ncbi:MAG: ABC transporter ATP-binding protein [Desulfobacterales bacterium]|nr:MAG: ABC transporter ATP-binding protein [Desulfobacterales bacterium]
MSKLTIENLTKKFGGVKAVDNFSLAIEEGEFIALVGPSGCGKTTTLRCVAGFIPVDEGQIILNEKIISSDKFMLPPERRNMAMVFQSYAVWPHKTVFKNISFGLELRKAPRSEIRDRVMKSLKLTKLTGLEKRYPNELSGGQQQRVALARGLVVEPEILLLDEPLSNLDATLREEMRFDLREIQQKLKITSIYVTHDQAEAMVIADRIVVMKDGKIEQIGSAGDIYHYPSSKFVAGFVGTTNLLEGIVQKKNESAFLMESSKGMILKVNTPVSEGVPDVGAKVFVSIRPESIELWPSKVDKMDNAFSGNIIARTFLGNFYDYRIKVKDEVLRVQATSHKELDINSEAWIYVDPNFCQYLKK